MDISELWEEYEGELTGYLRKRALNIGDAEDITSEVFLRALKSEVLLAGMSNNQCRLWLYTTAKRIGQQLGLSPATVRTHLRKARNLLRQYWNIN